MHDLLLCGVDPSMVDLSMCILQLQSEEGDSQSCQETEALIRAASRPWTPSHHAYLYGPEFKACIASLCLVKVDIMRVVALALHLNRDESENTTSVVHFVKFIQAFSRLSFRLCFDLPHHYHGPLSFFLFLPLDPFMSNSE